MKSIEKNIDRERNLTIFTVTGRVPAAEYVKKIHDFYTAGSVTKNVIWDSTEGDIRHLQPDDIRKFGKISRSFSKERSGGKTALVAVTDLAFGLARMYEFTSELDEISVESKVFRSLGEAMQWIESE